MEASPPFHRIFFIEQETENVKALEDLIKAAGHPAASVEQGDANHKLQALCLPSFWQKKRRIIFLDPFGMNVEWSTLELIAKTKALDVWFLFALAGTVRNLPRVYSRLDGSKRAAVTRVLGTDDWIQEFYGTDADVLTLPGVDPPPKLIRRRANVNQIEEYICARLRTIFPHVKSPRRLMANGNKSLFSLFFAMSNPSHAAIALARKGAEHILRTT